MHRLSIYLFFFIYSSQCLWSITAYSVRFIFHSKLNCAGSNNQNMKIDVQSVGANIFTNAFRFTVVSKNNSYLQILKFDCNPDVISRPRCMNSDRINQMISFHDQDSPHLVLLFRIEKYTEEIQKFFSCIMAYQYANRTLDLYCSIQNIPSITRPTTLTPYPSSKISLFTIIFLSACVILIVGLSIIWFLSIYYRRYRHYREKKKLRQAIARSTEEILRKSPVISYDANDPTLDHDDPTCAICLETFQAEDQLRKLVCSHVYHIKCIDPWLFTRQQCPLCNRNIFRNSIPSISSNIVMGTDDITTNRIYPTAPVENSPM